MRKGELWKRGRRGTERGKMIGKTVRIRGKKERGREEGREK